MKRIRLTKLKPGWWKERFVTLMVIPERTRRVHKVVVPFLALKLGIIVFSLAVVFFLFVGLDYARVLGRIAENKALKGENFRLRQELQLIRNKVDSMEFTVERVRNYAKKLQMLTGHADNKGKQPREAAPPAAPRVPANDPSGLEDGPLDEELHSRLELPKEEPKLDSAQALKTRIERVETASSTVETNLVELQDFLFGARSIAMATPSLVPINGYVSSGFGYRRHPYDGRLRFHRGLDLVAEPGTPVRAPAPGIIQFAGYKVGYGKVVVIDHGYGIRTLFAHNSQLFVGPGMEVKRGQVISQVGSTGMSTGPHLHYEVRKNGVPVNPAPFFQSAGY